MSQERRERQICQSDRPQPRDRFEVERLERHTSQRKELAVSRETSMVVKEISGKILQLVKEAPNFAHIFINMSIFQKAR